MFHVCLFVSCAKKTKRIKLPSLSDARGELWMSVDDVYEPATPPYVNNRRGGWPRPFHHVRAGQPLPKIVYEDDESLE